MGPLSLDVESSLSTRHHSVISKDKHIPLGKISDHSTLSELMELAVLNNWGSLLVVDTWSDGVPHASSPEWASLDKTSSVRLLINARSLVLQIVFDALDWEGATLKDQSSRLDQNQANDLILVVLAEAFDARVIFYNLSIAV